jgi:hypothetical protein
MSVGITPLLPAATNAPAGMPTASPLAPVFLFSVLVHTCDTGSKISASLKK